MRPGQRFSYYIHAVSRAAACRWCRDFSKRKRYQDGCSSLSYRSRHALPLSFPRMRSYWNRLRTYSRCKISSNICFIYFQKYIIFGDFSLGDALQKCKQVIVSFCRILKAWQAGLFSYSHFLYSAWLRYIASMPHLSVTRFFLRFPFQDRPLPVAWA